MKPHPRSLSTGEGGQEDFSEWRLILDPSPEQSLSLNPSPEEREDAKILANGIDTLYFF
jgi:hypothetical protein